MPLRPRLTASQAKALVDGLPVQILEPRISLWRRAVDLCVTLDLRSGAVYDALHWAAAVEAGADRFLTLNLRDFERFAVLGGPRLERP